MQLSSNEMMHSAKENFTEDELKSIYKRTLSAIFDVAQIAVDQIPLVKKRSYNGENVASNVEKIMNVIYSANCMTNGALYDQKVNVKDCSFFGLLLSGLIFFAPFLLPLALF